MQVSTMRTLDRWAGVPACAILSLYRRIFRPRPPQPVVPKRLVFVKLAEQGSTVLAHRALTRAIGQVGADNVFFLVFSNNRAILDVMGLIPAENVIEIHSDGLLATFRGALSAIARMRREKIDTAVDLEFFARSSAALSFLSGARWRVGFHAFHGEASYRGDLMTHRLLYNPHLHTSDAFDLLVASLEAPPDRLPTLPLLPAGSDPELPRFQPTDQELESVRGLLRRRSRTEGVPSLVLFNANCSDLLPLRRWPSERYVELAHRILDAEPETHVVFTGAPEEAPHVEAIVAQIGSERCFSVAGATTLRELFVLFHLARVFVTNDSGPAHFAALTPVEVIVLFGPETPRLFGARTPRNHVLWSGIACSPCVSAYNDRQSRCTDNVCMQQITTEEVFEKVQGLLRNERPISAESQV